MTHGEVRQPWRSKVQMEHGRRWRHATASRHSPIGAEAEPRKSAQPEKTLLLDLAGVEEHRMKRDRGEEVGKCFAAKSLIEMGPGNLEEMHGKHPRPEEEIHAS